MTEERSKNWKSGGKTLNLVFAGAIVLVALAIIVVTSNSIDSLHKNSAAMQKIKVRDLGSTPNPLPDSAVNTALNLKEHEIEDRVFRTNALSRPLEGSELVFVDGLKGEDHGKFADSVRLFSRVLKMVPEEAKYKTIWVAAGNNPSEKDLYLAFTYQQRAFCYLQQKQYQSAIDDLSKAIKLRPSYRLNYQNRSLAYRMIGQGALADADVQTEHSLKLEDSDKDKKPRVVE